MGLGRPYGVASPKKTLVNFGPLFRGAHSPIEARPYTARCSSFFLLPTYGTKNKNSDNDKRWCWRPTTDRRSASHCIHPPPCRHNYLPCIYERYVYTLYIIQGDHSLSGNVKFTDIYLTLPGLFAALLYLRRTFTRPNPKLRQRLKKPSTMRNLMQPRIWYHFVSCPLLIFYQLTTLNTYVLSLKSLWQYFPWYSPDKRPVPCMIFPGFPANWRYAPV